MSLNFEGAATGNMANQKRDKYMTMLINNEFQEIDNNLIEDDPQGEDNSQSVHETTLSEENQEEEYWQNTKDDYGFTHMKYVLVSEKQLWSEEDRVL